MGTTSRFGNGDSAPRPAGPETDRVSRDRVPAGPHPGLDRRRGPTRQAVFAAALGRVDLVHHDLAVRRPGMMLDQDGPRRRPIQEIVGRARRIYDPALAPIAHEQDQLVVVDPGHVETTGRIWVGA